MFNLSPSAKEVAVFQQFIVVNNLFGIFNTVILFVLLSVIV